MTSLWGSFFYTPGPGWTGVSAEDRRHAGRGPCEDHAALFPDPWPQAATQALIGTDVGIHSLPPTACTRGVPLRLLFFILFGEKTVRDSRPHAAYISIAQKWVLGVRQFKLAAFQLRLSFGVHPLRLAPSPACCIPSAMGTAYHAAYQFSGPSPLFFLSTVGRAGQVLRVRADRETG